MFQHHLLISKWITCCLFITKCTFYNEWYWSACREKTEGKRVHPEWAAFLSASSLSLTFLCVCVYEGLGLWAGLVVFPGYFYEDIRPLNLLENWYEHTFQDSNVISWLSVKEDFFNQLENDHLYCFRDEFWHLPHCIHSAWLFELNIHTDKLRAWIRHFIVMTRTWHQSWGAFVPQHHTKNVF